MKKLFEKHVMQTKVKIISKRKYGEPRLQKPKELKGIKQSFSVNWNPKCKCQCYVKDNNLYIKHRDFGSIDIYGLTLEQKKKMININQKFIYNDNFGCVVLRGEAWILLEDFIIDIKNNVFPPKLFYNLAEQITGDIGNCEWERFFEKVINKMQILFKERE